MDLNIVLQTWHGFPSVAFVCAFACAFVREFDMFKYICLYAYMCIRVCVCMCVCVCVWGGVNKVVNRAVCVFFGALGGTGLTKLNYTLSNY